MDEEGAFSPPVLPRFSSLCFPLFPFLPPPPSPPLFCSLFTPFFSRPRLFFHSRPLLHLLSPHPFPLMRGGPESSGDFFQTFWDFGPGGPERLLYQVQKNGLNIKCLGGMFLGHPGPRRRDIPDKNFMQLAFFCCFRQGVAGRIWVGTSRIWKNSMQENFGLSFRTLLFRDFGPEGPERLL